MLTTLLLAATLLTQATRPAPTPATRPAEAPVTEMALQDLLAAVEANDRPLHPATYYLLAARLLEADRPAEAGLWMYVGQIRYRVHLLANPDLEPSGDPALFGALTEQVGRPVNEWLGGDVTLWRETVADARAWDTRHANLFTPKDANAAAYEQTTSGLAEFEQYLADNADNIRAQREANGSENRSTD